jgi:hypothetical protein
LSIDHDVALPITLGCQVGCALSLEADGCAGGLATSLDLDLALGAGRNLNVAARINVGGIRIRGSKHRDGKSYPTNKKLSDGSTHGNLSPC